MLIDNNVNYSSSSYQEMIIHKFNIPDQGIRYNCLMKDKNQLHTVCIMQCYNIYNVNIHFHINHNYYLIENIHSYTLDKLKNPNILSSLNHLINKNCIHLKHYMINNSLFSIKDILFDYYHHLTHHIFGIHYISKNTIYRCCPIEFDRIRSKVCMCWNLSKFNILKLGPDTISRYFHFYNTLIYNYHMIPERNMFYIQLFQSHNDNKLLHLIHIYLYILNM